jgi:hypothetical protein
MKEINAEGLITNYIGSDAISPLHHPLNNEKIRIPKTFLKVILNFFPEFRDVKSVGFREHAQYNPYTFGLICRYLVEIDIYFNEPNGCKKSKEEYESLIYDYFKMTYHDMDFITFKIQSLIIPPEKTNRDKFLELFGDE